MQDRVGQNGESVLPAWDKHPQAGPTNGRTAVLGVVVAHRRMGWFKVICGCTGKISVIRFRLKGPIGVLVTGLLCVRTENY